MIRITAHKAGGFEVDIRVLLPDGRKHRERRKSPVSSRSGTERWAREREALLCRASVLDAEKPPPSPVTFAEFYPRFIEQHYLAERLKPSSVASAHQVIRFYLLPRFGNLPLSRFTISDVQQLKAELAKLSPKTVNNVLSCLSMLLKCARKWGVITEHPHIDQVKKTSASLAFYDFDQYERLVAAAQAVDHQTYLLVLLGGEAGLRTGEMIALRQTDIQGGKLVVSQSEWKGHVTSPKSGKPRTVPLTMRLSQAIRTNRHIRPDDRLLYRTDLSQKPLARALLVKRLARAQRKAGLPGSGSLHILRHTFCSHLSMRGAPARAIQELAGHSNLTTTMRYMHLSPSTLDQAIDLLNPRGGSLVTRGVLGEELLGSVKNP